MISLRARLFVILILSTGVIWASAVSWIYLRSSASKRPPAWSVRSCRPPAVQRHKANRP